MNAHHDIAVVGSGFAGSLLAMIARRLGHSVVLIEKGVASTRGDRGVIDATGKLPF